MLKLLLIREPVVRVSGGESFTPGTLFANNLFLGVTCEDEERQGAKVYGRTAIPRGSYSVEVSFSNRFKKELPAVLNVPGFDGIRIHGGNRAEDSLGCILLGQVRTATGIAQCASSVGRLIALIKADKNVTLEIK